MYKRNIPIIVKTLSRYIYVIKSAESILHLHLHTSCLLNCRLPTLATFQFKFKINTLVFSNRNSVVVDCVIKIIFFFFCCSLNALRSRLK